MKITKLELIKIKPRWMFLKMYTDTDIIGLGEPVLEGHCTSVEAVIKEFEEYLTLYADYTLVDVDTDSDGDVWYTYTKDDVVVDTVFYYYEDYSVIEVYVYSSLSTEPDGGGTGTPDTGYQYTDFTAEEKALFNKVVGMIIPFLPNDNYGVEEYTLDWDDCYEWGISFYTVGNTEAEFNAYRRLFSSYTLDGSEPDLDSPVYEGPIEITSTCTLKAKAFREGFVTKTYEKEFKGHKAMGRPVSLLTQPHASYVYGAPDCLTDGILGKDTYTSGDWAGWYDVPFEAVVDMDGRGEYSEVSLGAFVFKHDWIFNPVDMTVSVSDDGKEYREVAYAAYETIPNVDEGNGRQEYTLRFEPVQARYLRVKASVVTPIPDWHAGAGKPGFVFVDEITVN